MLTNNERSTFHKRFTSLFSQLWGCRNGVVGSWGSSSHGYHPTYIRRGPLLLRGELHLNDVWVIVPPDAQLTRVAGDPRSNCDTMPTTDATLARVTDWFSGAIGEFLAQQLDLMEVELRTTLQARSDAERQKRQAEQQAAAENQARADAVVAGYVAREGVQC